MGDTGMANGVRRQGSHFSGILIKTVLFGEACGLFKYRHYQVS